MVGLVAKLRNLMKKILFVVLLLCVGSLQAGESIRIAYIGASYWTAGGGLSVIFPEMLRARGWSVDNEGLIGSLSYITTDYQEETEIPSWVLRSQQNAARILDDAEELDYLFVMGHSSNPFDPKVDLGARVKQLVERVRETHEETEIVLVSTWARPYETDQWDVVHDLYESIGNEQDFPVVSLAALWHEAEEQNSPVALYRSEQDGRLNHHNGFAGSYVNGCLLYAFVTGEKFVSEEDDFMPKKFHPQQIKPGERPWELTRDEKIFLENLAWDVFKKDQD